MIKVLHIIRDDKFFDGVFHAFEDDKRLVNTAVLISKKKPYGKFRHIMNSSQVNVVKPSEMRQLLKYADYDVIFFHSLRAYLWGYFRFIPKDKVVVWWAWGFDLYEGIYGLEPLIKLDFYKPQTLAIVDRNHLSLRLRMSHVFRALTRPYYKWLQKKVLQRVDYFQPVWKIEYEQLRDKYKLRAKEFYYNHSFFNGDNDIQLHLAGGNIMLGNSATPMNNHLDVLGIVELNKQSVQKVIIPLSYGDFKYRDYLLEQIRQMQNKQDLLTLIDFMTPEEYWRIYNSCSYACYGVIRQQAGGNIGFALANGVKVFLYKNSMAYKSFSELGFVVFALEDVDSNSFRTPLNMNQVRNNINAIKNEYVRRQNIYERCIQEIEKRVNKKMD